MRSMFFTGHNPNTCCLCDSTSNLSGEHKFKRSVLRQEFGTATMAIGKFGAQGVRYAQGPKSSLFHFSSRLCALCNGDRTQPADREFDRLHELATELVRTGHDPSEAMSNSRYAIGSVAYLNAFRYFAKILCCHIAEVGGPRPTHLSKFSIGESDRNPVFLRIYRDRTLDMLSEGVVDAQYAAHGGLVILCNKTNGWPNGFRSTLTFGPVGYEFWSKLNRPAQVALFLGHRQFAKRCREQARQYLRSTN